MMTFTPIFFDWMWEKLIMIYYHPYVKGNLCGDPKLILLEGEQWNNAGKNKVISNILVFWIL